MHKQHPQREPTYEYLDPDEARQRMDRARRVLAGILAELQDAETVLLLDEVGETPTRDTKSLSGSP